MSIAYARLRAALASGDLDFIRFHARELPAIRLGDALRICLLMRDQDPERYEQAALRWIGRFALEARTATLADVRMAADALGRLPSEADNAMTVLQRLCLNHGLGD
ncbi:MAG: hypothetical protein ABSC56_04955 [Solirubrobacteraceae bacterium]